MPAKQLSIPKFLIALLVLPVVAMSILLFTNKDNFIATPASEKAIWDLGHIGYFGILVLLFLLTVPKRLPANYKSLIWLIVFGLLLGASIELIQFFIGRSMNPMDMVKNFIGILSGWALVAWLSGHSHGLVWLLISSSAIGVNVLPVVSDLRAEYRMRQQFPLLANFEDWGDLNLWAGSVDYRRINDPEDENNKVLEVNLTTNHISGVTLFYFPRDWRSYSHLRLRAYNPYDEPFTILCWPYSAIHHYNGKIYSHRVNGERLLKPGWNQLTISLTSTLESEDFPPIELDDVSAFTCFTFDLPEPRQLLLDDLILINIQEKSD